MSNVEKQPTAEEMKALLDSIGVKYRSNATGSSLKHLISKHKAKVESVVKTSQELTESDLDETADSSDGDKVYEKSVSNANILSENTTPVSDEVAINNRDVNLLHPQLIMTTSPETNNSVIEKFLKEEGDSPKRLVIKRNVLKKFVEELFTAGRSGYTLSNERYSVSIMDMPWRTVLVKGDTGNVQPLVDPAIKIKVKTYKSKDFINELLHFARYGARIGAIKNITIDSGHYVFEVLVDKEYILRKNKDYYSGRV